MAITRQNEILSKALPSDPNIIPRYDIVAPDGTVIPNAQIILKNSIVQEGTPFNKAVLDELLAASGITTGNENAYVLEQPGFILEDGATVRFKLHVASGSGPTLNVNNTGAKPLMSTATKYMKVGTDAGMWVTAIYNATMQAYIVQGNGFIPTETTTKHKYIFTESTTFNPATYGLTLGDIIKVTCIGGGGGGGSGGCSGKYSYTITGADGGDGAPSSFGNLVVAEGGKGGKGGSPSSHGVGGIGRYSGGNGGDSYTVLSSRHSTAGGGGAGGYVNENGGGGQGNPGNNSNTYSQASTGGPGWGGCIGKNDTTPTLYSAGGSDVFSSQGSIQGTIGCGNPGLHMGGGRAGIYTIDDTNTKDYFAAGGGGSGYGAGGGGSAGASSILYNTFGGGGGGSGYIVTKQVTIENITPIDILVGGGGGGASGGSRDITQDNDTYMVPIKGNNGTTSGGGSGGHSAQDTLNILVGGAGGYGDTQGQGAVSSETITLSRDYADVILGGGGGGGGAVIVEW